MLRAIYVNEAGWRVLRDLDAISDLIKESRTLVWAFADVAELADDLPVIAEEFDLDPLAVEDATRLRQRPKIEQYASHLFTVMHQLDEVDEQFEARQIACFVGHRWVLTIHESAQKTIQEVGERLTAMDPREQHTPAVLMHVLLDTVVDDYERLGDDLESTTERLEDEILKSPTIEVQRELYSLKQRVSRLRRYVGAGERVLAAMLTRGTGAPAEMEPMFRDVHDHTQRINEQVENVSQIIDAMIDLQRSAQANALNETTKRLTGWAAIIAVPTFIASVYGMNFALVPEDGKITGFWFALGLMALSSIGLYTYFKRRSWI